MTDQPADRPGLAADNSAADLTAQLSEVWDALAVLGAELTDDEWTQATPCPGWPVAAHYAHIIGTESTLLGRPNPGVDPGRPAHVRNDIGGFNEVWVASLGAEPRARVLARFEEVIAARKAALAQLTEEDFNAPSWTPVGQADYRRFMQIRAFDCWVHEQDIRDAVGRPGHEDGPVVEQSIDEIVRAIGYIVGKKAGLPPESSVRISLIGPVKRQVDVAFVNGRAAAVDKLESEPSVHLQLSSTAFERLAAGRVDAQAVLAGAFGGVSFDGDADLGRRVVSNLAFTI
jgi:uncharacterized protein (TIGR03083 family)